MIEPAAAWFNGGVPPPSLVFSRGLHYGDGVFRTLLKNDFELLDFDEHFDKLANDAAALDLMPHAVEILRQEAQGISDGIARCVIKLMLVRAASGRGYRAKGRDSDRIVLRYPAPAWPARHWEQGISAIRSPVQLPRQPDLAGIKHLNRLENVLASRDWPEGIEEAILCDCDGSPVCGSRTNLFWLKEQTLHTPATDRCGVAGLMRDKVLAIATRLRLQAKIVRASWQELLDADEAFVCNSLIGIWPLQRLQRREWKSPGPLTSMITGALRHPRLTSSGAC